MKLLESGEMYLETIYVLGKRGKAVRSIDICAELGIPREQVNIVLRMTEEGSNEKAGV